MYELHLLGSMDIGFSHDQPFYHLRVALLGRDEEGGCSFLRKRQWQHTGSGADLFQVSSASTALHAADSAHR
jgi:hypothetical protein